MAFAYQVIVEVLRAEALVVKPDGIDGFEHVRDGDAHGASVGAVTAAGTADLRHVEHAVPYLLDQREF